MEDQAERLRVEVARCFEALGPPPVYVRVDEALKQKLSTQREQLKQLRKWAAALTGAPGASALAQALAEGEAMVDAVERGAFVAAEGAWARLLAKEQEANRHRKAFSHAADERAPVWNEATRTSRFDAREHGTTTVRLPCPWPRCRQESTLALPAALSLHELSCGHCGKAYRAYVGPLRHLEVTPRGGDARHYRFEVGDGQGGAVAVELHAGGPGELRAVRGDLMAFLYLRSMELSGVVDLSSSKVLWVGGGGACFLVSAVYGPQAPELHTFRAFRDRSLLPNASGRLLVRGYYAVGPSLAAVVKRSASLQRLARAALNVVERSLR